MAEEVGKKADNATRAFPKRSTNYPGRAGPFCHALFANGEIAARPQLPRLDIQFQVSHFPPAVDPVGWVSVLRVFVTH